MRQNIKSCLLTYVINRLKASSWDYYHRCRFLTDDINYRLLFTALSQQGSKINILIENHCGFGVEMSCAWCSVVIRVDLEKAVIHHSATSRLKNPMDRGAWSVIVHGGHKESGKTEWLSARLNKISLLTYAERRNKHCKYSIMYSAMPYVKGDYFLKRHFKHKLRTSVTLL